MYQLGNNLCAEAMVYVGKVAKGLILYQKYPIINHYE